MFCIFTVNKNEITNILLQYRGMCDVIDCLKTDLLISDRSCIQGQLTSYPYLCHFFACSMSLLFVLQFIPGWGQRLGSTNTFSSDSLKKTRLKICSQFLANFFSNRGKSYQKSVFKKAKFVLNSLKVICFILDRSSRIFLSKLK